MTVYPLSAVRALALHTQGLTVPNGDEPAATQDHIDRVADTIAAVQIDTLHVVHRSQYLTLWSRLGNFDPADFDALSYREPRRWFEGWFHAACYLPLTDYRYRLPWMAYVREHPGRRTRELLKENADLLDYVRDRIRQEGPLRTADFKSDGKKRGSWWDWKPAKVALEYLYACGELMISDRVNFHRVYDLTERVLPGWVDTTMPTQEETTRHNIMRQVQMFGICQPNQVRGRMVRLKASDMTHHVDAMLESGDLVQVQATVADGSVETLIVPREHMPLLERAADGDIPTPRTTFLNPFDNLFW